jgi:nitric oxide dioxygenase
MVSERFYSRLLKAHPELQPMFRGDIRIQGQQFTRFITSIIHDLEDGPRVTANLKALGLRHRQYGVERRHYELASKIFLSSVRLTAGIQFSYEVRKSWEAFYVCIVDCMAPEKSEATLSDKRIGLHQ